MAFTRKTVPQEDAATVYTELYHSINVMTDGSFVSASHIQVTAITAYVRVRIYTGMSSDPVQKKHAESASQSICSQTKGKCEGPDPRPSLDTDKAKSVLK